MREEKEGDREGGGEGVRRGGHVWMEKMQEGLCFQLPYTFSEITVVGYEEKINMASFIELLHVCRHGNWPRIRGFPLEKKKVRPKE